MPTNEFMNKMAAIEKGQSNVNRLIVSNLARYSELESALSDFIASPNEETAKFIDERYRECLAGLDLIRSSIQTLAETVFSQRADSNESGDDIEEVEIAAEEDDNGIRLY